MAFEDRCSPQSAPSPQGIPHTPQKTIKSDSSNISRHNYASDTSISEFTHKEEESIDNDDFMTDKSKEIANKFSFSISNILSENFGRTVSKNLLQKCAKKEKIFRPFEIVDTKNNHHHDNSRQPSPSNTSNNMLFYNNLSENENSNNSMQDSYENSKNKMLIKNIQLAELLHLTSKRLYEENSKNSDRKVPLVNNFASYSRSIEELPEHNNQPQHMFSPSAYVPPLGSLSKAVSQIGQSNFSDLVLPPSFSSFTSASSATTSPKYCSDNPLSPESHYKPQSLSSQQDNIDSDDCKSEASSSKDDGQKMWPAWIYCTRYSDRPSSGPRYRRPKDKKEKEEKRPRTAFSNEQLTRLKREFNENRYLTEKRRQQLSSELGLNEAQIKIWFQNKRAKIKKSSGTKNALALQLMAQGLYNHSTVPLTKEEEELELRMNGKI